MDDFDRDVERWLHDREYAIQYRRSIEALDAEFGPQFHRNVGQRMRDAQDELAGWTEAEKRLAWGDR